MFIDFQRKRKGERGKHPQVCILHKPGPGMELVNQVCALIWNRTHSLLVYRVKLNQLTHLTGPDRRFNLPPLMDYLDKENLIHVIYLFLRFLFLFNLRESRRKRGKETSMCERCTDWLPLKHTLWGPGNRTRDLLVHRPALNPLTHTSQGLIHFKYNTGFWLVYNLSLKAPQKVGAQWLSRKDTGMRSEVQ